MSERTPLIDHQKNMSPTITWKGSSEAPLQLAPSSKTLDNNPDPLENNIPDPLENNIPDPLENNSTDHSPDHLENKNTDASTVQSKLIGCGRHLSTMRVELLAFVFTFSYTMTKISSTTMIMEKVCRVHFGYNSSICDDLENLTYQNLTDVKLSVERLTTNYQLCHSLIQIVPAAILSCFVGPWSDHYGRKSPIMLAIVGMILDAAGSTVCAHFLYTRVEYYFIPALFTGLFGGPVSILAVIYSYAADCTPDMVQRTLKFAFIDMAAGFSIPFGATAGGWIFKYMGYTPVFYFSMGGLCLSLVVVVFLLRETRGLDNRDGWGVKLRRLFSCQSLVESFQAVKKERPHKGRKQIILLVFSLCFLVITLNSTGDINYLFAHHQFHWSNTKYSTITSIYSVIAILVLVIVIPLMKRYRMQDPHLGLIGTVSLLGKNIGIAIAWREGIYHLANLFGSLGGCSAFAARARISKVVSSEDLGKVFSFVAASESLFPILTTVMTSQLFAAFLDTFPGMPYLTLSCFLVLPLAVFSWMLCLPKMTYEDISKTQKTEAA